MNVLNGGKDMVLRERKGTIDGYEWRCRTKVGENPYILNDVKVNKNTVVDWYIFCKEVCMVVVLNESEPLGDEGKIVEIDERLFGKMKGDANGTKEELLSVIKGWVVPGSIIILDCWKAHNCLLHEGYQPLWVSHSLTFKNPETIAHTNSIEGTWSAIKRLLRNHPVYVESEFLHYLADYMWQCQREHLINDGVFWELLHVITSMYPPMEKDVPSEAHSNRAPSVPNASTLSITPKRSSSCHV
ncbi:mitotic-spindle organizing protein 2A [Trichonephila clavipes]|nr:mitotic-spindle organizing protein 2A [Trichonephila clavipes]